MSDSERRTSLERQLATFKRNVDRLEERAASYGGELNLPTADANQLEYNRQKVAEILAQLDALGGGARAPGAPAAGGTSGISISNSPGASASNSGVAAGRDAVGSQNQGQASPGATAPAGTSDGAGQRQAAPQQPAQQVTLEFQPQADGASIMWRATVLGESATAFAPPYDAATLPLVIKALDAAQYPEHPHDGPQFSPAEQQSLAALGLWQNGRVPESAYKVVGVAIFNRLGPDGQAKLSAVRNSAIAQRLTTNYILRFPAFSDETVRLAALPWEALSDRSRAVLLSGSSEVDSCERYIATERAIRPPAPSGQRLHLLALLPKYAIDDETRAQEAQQRRKVWDKLRDAGKITYDEINEVTLRALSDYMRDDSHPRPDVIHYLGHGVYANGEGNLVLDNGRGGFVLANPERLERLFGDVRLIVLHACQSSMFNLDTGLLSGVGPSLSLVADAVVSMQLSMRTDAATRFSEVFYDELLRKGRSLQQAVAEGRETLFVEEVDGASWYVPTLYIRGREQQPVYLVSA